MKGRGIEQRLREAVPFGDEFADGLYAVLFHQVVQEGHPVFHLLQPLGRHVDPGVGAFQFLRDVLQFQPRRFQALRQGFQGRDEPGGAGGALSDLLELGREGHLGRGANPLAAAEQFFQLFRMGELLLLGVEFLQFAVPQFRGV